MNIADNPFSPNAGTRPPWLAGRQFILDQCLIARTHLLKRGFAKSLLFSGLRGVGKTVLLGQIDTLMAREKQCHTIYIEAREKHALATLLIPHLRHILLQADGSHPGVRYALQALKSFINCIRLKYKDVEISLEVPASPGVADTGDIETDLPMLLLSIGQALRDTRTALALVIDEMQLLTQKELGALIMALHRIAQKQLPIVLMGAGLPQLKYLVGESRSYSERLFNFLDVDRLNEKDTILALQEPLKAEGAQFSRPALAEIVKQSQGYPYFVQEWGFHSWNLSSTSRISLKVVQKATAQALQSLDAGFFSVRFDRLTDNEQHYIHALAQLGAGSHKSGDVADKMEKTTQAISGLREGLIRKGIVYSPSYAYVAFTVPLFDQFVQRTMKK